MGKFYEDLDTLIQLIKKIDKKNLNSLCSFLRFFESQEGGVHVYPENESQR